MIQKRIPRSLRSILTAMTLLLTLGVPGAVLSSPAEECAPSQAAMGVPLKIEFFADESDVLAGSTTEIQIVVRAGAPLERVQIRTMARGKADLVSSADFDLDSLGAGETFTFTVPVNYKATGESGILVEAFAILSGAGISFSESSELGILLRDDRAFIGVEDMINLRRRALDYDIAAGQVTEEQATVRRRELGTADTVPTPLSLPEAAPLSPRHASLRVDAVPVEEWESEVEDAGATEAVSATNITVSGTVRYTDENGVLHPVFGYDVQIRDDDFIGSDLLAHEITGTDGTYSATFDSGDPGGPDIFVRFQPENTLIEVRQLGGGGYENNTPVQDDVASNSNLVVNITFAATGSGPVGSVLSGMTWIAVYTRDDLNSGVGLGQIPVEFPGATNAAFYNGSLINMRPNDRFDWDVMHHEYGHYVMDSFNFENNPGGAHNLGQCLAVTRPSKSEGLRLAFGEAWPTFFGTSGQRELGIGATQAPRVGNVLYEDTVNGFGGFSYSLEGNSNDLGANADTIGLGEDNEVAVQRGFWDLYDAASDSRDAPGVSNGDLAMANVLRGTNVTTMSAAWALVRSSGLIPDNESDLEAGAITTDHGIGPQPASPTSGTIVNQGTANFSWSRAVGCSTTFDGDSFDLVFFNANTFAQILTIAGLGSPSYSLTPGEFATVRSGGHDVLWAVEGRNTGSPATGPYLGDNIDIIVNTPPEADAGTDIIAECTSPTTTPVKLDGTGSSDADGDPLTYSWTAPGVTFDDATLSQPTGGFTKTTTTATLEVSDGFQTDTDTVDVTVRDTTPPVITCPQDIIVECTESGGTPSTDPQLDPFFAGVSATDVCDTNPVITDDRPAFFNVNTTTAVEFTATDADGNAVTCEANVTVLDTTPPEIEVTNDPDRLWPPNHRMVDIAATVTVTDICDPNPTFRLISITSNEPDNGIGDGDTENDIQGADFGTADVNFQLRAERTGGGDGRVYTITYEAMDMSGNTAISESTVVVPHDMSEPLILAVEEQFGTVLHWPPVLGAFTYNVIRGSVANITETADSLDLGPVVCLKAHSVTPNTFGSFSGDQQVPAMGEAFFYLSEFNNGTYTSYGTESAAKPRLPATGACE